MKLILPIILIFNFIPFVLNAKEKVPEYMPHKPTIVKASYYGPHFHGKRTASGERFNQWGNTIAHKTLPFGTKLRITNIKNGKSVDVKVTDRGNFYKLGRELDLSMGAAKKIGMIKSGVEYVQVENI